MNASGFYDADLSARIDGIYVTSGSLNALQCLQRISSLQYNRTLSIVRILAYVYKNALEFQRLHAHIKHLLKIQFVIYETSNAPNLEGRAFANI
jgi:hypothetical protein